MESGDRVVDEELLSVGRKDLGAESTHARFAENPFQVANGFCSIVKARLPHRSEAKCLMKGLGSFIGRNEIDLATDAIVSHVRRPPEQILVYHSADTSPLDGIQNDTAIDIDKGAVAALEPLEVLVFVRCMTVDGKEKCGFATTETLGLARHRKQPRHASFVQQGGLPGMRIVEGKQEGNVKPLQILKGRSTALLCSHLSFAFDSLTSSTPTDAPTPPRRVAEVGISRRDSQPMPTASTGTA